MIPAGQPVLSLAHEMARHRQLRRRGGRDRAGRRRGRQPRVRRRPRGGGAGARGAARARWGAAASLSRRRDARIRRRHFFRRGLSLLLLAGLLALLRALLRARLLRAGHGRARRGRARRLLVLLRAACRLLPLRAELPQQLAARRAVPLLTWLPNPRPATTSRLIRTRFTSKRSSPTVASAPS